jgi:hypothetical protein
MPGQYLHREASPLVLSIRLHRRDLSTRWKQVVKPYPGRFMHHLELYSIDDLDEKFLQLLAEAWIAAGDPT